MEQAGQTGDLPGQFGAFTEKTDLQGRYASQAKKSVSQSTGRRENASASEATVKADKAEVTSVQELQELSVKTIKVWESLLVVLYLKGAWHCMPGACIAETNANSLYSSYVPTG